jgi:hypothetical protein
MKLGFDSLCLYPVTGRPIISLQRRNRGDRIRIFGKHIEYEREIFKKINGVDFEIIITRNDNDQFLLDYAHVFNFLLIIKTGGWINAPAVLSSSMFSEPDWGGRTVVCSEFIDATPCQYSDKTLSESDAMWIQAHIPTTLQFTEQPRFQNAMQALNCYHCIPYATACLVTIWSGLEALFETDQEISFRLGLYISNFLRRGELRDKEFKRLRQSYTARSRITHGRSTNTKQIGEHAAYTRDILRECLAKSIEMGCLPNPSQLVFSR